MSCSWKLLALLFLLSFVRNKARIQCYRLLLGIILALLYIQHDFVFSSSQIIEHIFQEFLKNQTPYIASYWDGIYFLHSRFYGSLFKISDQNKTDSTLRF